MTILDLRDRCARDSCAKLIRKGKQSQAEYARYRPYCSYHCQQWAGIDSARRHLATLEQTK